MAKDFPYPTEYQYDKDTYEAAFRWLGYLPLTAGKVPLPKFLYDNIAADLSLKKGKRTFDSAQAVQSTTDAAKSYGFSYIPDKTTLPAGAFELFLKSIYKGIFLASKDGYDKTCSFISFTEKKNIMHQPVIVIKSKDTDELQLLLCCEMLSPDLLAVQKEIDKNNRHRTIQAAQFFELLGYTLQCEAHFTNDNISEYLTPKFSKEIADFLSEAIQKFKAIQISGN